MKLLWGKWRNASFVCVLLFVLSWVFTAVQKAEGALSPLPPVLEPPTGILETKQGMHPKIDSRVMSSLASDALPSASALHADSSSSSKKPEALETAPSRMLVLRLDAQMGETAAVRHAVEEVGGEIEIEYDGVLQALIPADRVERLAHFSSVRYISFPTLAREDAISGEGVPYTNAVAWHNGGITGEGVSVGIIDVGFSAWSTAEKNGDVPEPAATLNHCDAGFSLASKHGTAVAEILHETAPAAELYLACIDTDLEFASAYLWLRQQGVRVISTSISWDEWPADGHGGPGSPESVVSTARQDGIFWTTSAGNHAMRHWGGTFQDNDGNGRHDFVPGAEANGFVIPANESREIVLKWHDWPISAVDYDLFLYDENAKLVASSTNYQTGSQPPLEILEYKNTSARAGHYWIVIEDHGSKQAVAGEKEKTGKTAPHIDLYVRSAILLYQTRSSSIVSPAASPHVMAVGAIYWGNDTLEFYSSRGPTLDGRRKPDIVAPARVASLSYNYFSGTSASTPHVAGAAALLLERFPEKSPEDVEQQLLSWALDLGLPGPDNAYGAGRLFLPW